MTAMILIITRLIVTIVANIESNTLIFHLSPGQYTCFKCYQHTMRMSISTHMYMKANILKNSKSNNKFLKDPLQSLGLAALLGVSIKA